MAYAKGTCIVCMNMWVYRCVLAGAYVCTYVVYIYIVYILYCIYLAFLFNY